MRYDCYGMLHDRPDGYKGVAGDIQRTWVCLQLQEVAQYADANRQTVSICQFVYKIAVMLTGEIQCNS